MDEMSGDSRGDKGHLGESLSSDGFRGTGARGSGAEGA